MGLLSRTDDWCRVESKLDALPRDDRIRVQNRFAELDAERGSFTKNHEMMQMALDEVLTPKVSLSVQADEYDEVMRAHQILDDMK